MTGKFKFLLSIPRDMNVTLNDVTDKCGLSKTAFITNSIQDKIAELNNNNINTDMSDPKCRNSIKTPNRAYSCVVKAISSPIMILLLQLLIMIFGVYIFALVFQ